MILVRLKKGVKPLKFEIVRNDNKLRDKKIKEQMKEAKLLWSNTQSI